MATIFQAPGPRLLLLAILLVAGSLAGALAGAPSPAELQEAFTDSGLLGAVAFAALYAVLTVALIPGSALTVAAGAIFGPVAGTLVSIAGAVIGATAAFALARRASRGSLEQVQGERAARVQQRLREHGLLSIIALRLIPLVPFNLLNYLAGASAIRARDYVLGTAVGIVPGAIAFATLGGSIHDPGSPAFLVATMLVVALTLTGAIAARRRPPRARAAAPTERPAEARDADLRRLAWSAAFLLTVAGTLLASGLYH